MGWQGIAYSNGRFVAVGTNGAAAYIDITEVALSFNANGTVTWKKV
jgi:hypothetical protein